LKLNLGYNSIDNVNLRYKEQKTMKNFLFNILTFLTLALGNQHGYICPDGGSGEGGDSGSQDQDNNQDDSGNPPDDGKGKADDGGDSGNQRLEDLPDWAQKQIKDLRKESAGHRNKYKSLEDRFGKIESSLKKAFGDEDDDLTPEQRLEATQMQLEQQEFQTAITNLALENGIGKDDLDYLGFLVEKQAGALEEGQELSDDDLLEIVQKVKSRNQGPADSSVDGKGGNGNPPAPKGDEVTFEKFSKMSIMEKTKLFRENRALYDKYIVQMGGRA
jgi:hypothetical protein